MGQQSLTPVPIQCVLEADKKWQARYQRVFFAEIFQQQRSDFRDPVALGHTRLLCADNINVVCDHTQDAVAFLADAVRTQPRNEVVRRHLIRFTRAIHVHIVHHNSYIFSLYYSDMLQYLMGGCYPYTTWGYKAEVTSSNSLHTFKTKLKSHLFLASFP